LSPVCSSRFSDWFVVVALATQFVVVALATGL